jgi:hypothetical protein
MNCCNDITPPAPLPVQEPKQAIHAKFRELYDAVGYMVCEVGRAGTIDPRNPLVTTVMSALHRIDGAMSPHNSKVLAALLLATIPKKDEKDKHEY